MSAEPSRLGWMVQPPKQKGGNHTLRLGRPATSQRHAPGPVELTGFWQNPLRQNAGRRIRKHRAVCSLSRPRNDKRKQNSFGRWERDRVSDISNERPRSSNKPPIANDDHARRKSPTMIDDSESSASSGLLTDKRINRNNSLHWFQPGGNALCVMVPRSHK